MKNLKNKCVLTLVFALGTFLLSGCFQSKNSIIRVCYPTKKLIKKSVEYTDHTPLTAHRLRKMLENDTTHYKIVVIYSVCCGPCNVKMENVYAPMYKSLDTSVCRMYFVLDDCGSLPWNADYMAQYGVKDLYYLQHSYETSAFVRSYLPIGSSKIFGLFGEFQLNYTFSEGKNSTGTGEMITAVYERIHNLELGLAGGMAVFLTNNVAAEVMLNVGGYRVRWGRQNTNNMEKGSITNSDANFRVNLFSIKFGVTYYL